MTLSRRTFSTAIASTVAGATLASPWLTNGRPAKAEGPRRARATSDRYLVFCHFPGAWDVQLSLDPKDPKIFTADKVSQTRIETGYDLLPITNAAVLDSKVPGMRFGPYIGKMIDHADRIALVRGMSMDTLSHPVGVRYFNTGRTPAGLAARGSSIASVAAGLLGEHDAIANLTAAVETYNIDQPAYASGVRVTRVDDLVAALRSSGSELKPEERSAVEAFLQARSTCPQESMSPVRSLAHAQHLASQTLVAQGLGDRFDFAAKTPEMEALRGRYGFSVNELNSPQARMAMASVALCSGVSRVVSLAACPGLDTHGGEWATEQGPNQQIGFDALATLISDLAAQEFGSSGESWLDHTTILAYSDFGRTALLNPNQGRDHSLSTSCLVVGGKIRGGQVIGASSDVGMEPQALDFQTGVLAKDGKVVRPSNVLRAILLAAGIEDDVANLGAEPLRALVI